MSQPRKRYRRYKEPGENPNEIPHSTFYRWKRLGRSTPNQKPVRHGQNKEDRASSCLQDPVSTVCQPQSSVPSDRNDLNESLENFIGDEPMQDEESPFSYGDESESFLREDTGVQHLSTSESFEDLHLAAEQTSETCASPLSFLSFDCDAESVHSAVSYGSAGGYYEDAQEASEDVQGTPIIPSSNLLAPEVLNQPLVPSLSITKFETLLMIFHLVMRHGMTGVFVEDMLKFTNTLVGDPNAIPGSKFLFQKLFMTGKTLDIHFYCPDCQKYLGLSSSFTNKNDVIQCHKCKTIRSVSSLNDGKFFVSLSIGDQLKRILSRQDIDLIYPANNRTDGVISDIFDGLIYKDLLEFCVRNGKEHPLTITFNTDGSPVYKSTRNSLWPIQFILNEINPKVRFNLENVMLAGVWFGSKSPIMKIFLKPFINELKVLRSSGVQWTTSGGCTVSSPVYAICCCTDSVAKPKVQNHHQFNGAYGCGYCYHPGKSVMVNPLKGTYNLRFVADDNYSYRQDSALRDHMKMASKLPENDREKHVFGSLGVSPLTSLPLFNVVYGFGIDYMHGVLEGVLKRLCGLWFDTKNRAEDFYIGNKINIVNKRISTISPPSGCRRPRAMTDRIKYKANEWRGFLFYYSLPCLIDVLPEQYYSHFRKLVLAIYVLMQTSFSKDDLQRADFLLYDFVWDFGILYGDSNMVYNVHLLLHLGKIVKMQGPLWAYSAFCFESGNGKLVRLVRGTTGVTTQIVKKYHMTSAASELILGQHYEVCDDVLNFCDDVVCYKELKNAQRINNVTLLGRSGILYLSEEEKQLICQDQDNNTPAPDIVQFFYRVVQNGIKYHGNRNAKQERFDDSCVKLRDGTFARIEVIFVNTVENMCGVWCFARNIRLAPDDEQVRLAPHIMKTCLDAFGSLKLLPFTSVESKCLLLNCDNTLYISKFPNCYESD